MKKFIFPFFNKGNHEFLLKKWWFRMIIVIYNLILISAPFLIWYLYVFFISSPCYSSLPLFYGTSEIYNQISECSKIARNAWLPGAAVAIIGTLVTNYVIQIIFFKIIINFIVLGNKK